jgi:hypothetical protein
MSLEYVVYDGRELRARRPCSAVDLSAIRTATAE